MTTPHLNVGRNPRREWRAGEPKFIKIQRPVRKAAAVFMEDGAAAASRFLGTRNDLMLAVFFRAQYLERCTRRFAEMTGIPIPSKA